MCICWIHIFFEYDGIVFIPSFWKSVSLFEKGLYLVLLKHLKLQNILRVTFAFRRYFLKLTNVSFSMHDQCSRYLKSSANITRLISRYVISAEQKLKMFYLHIWQIWLGDNLHAFLKDYLKLNEPTYHRHIHLKLNSQDFYEKKLDTYHNSLSPEFSFYHLVKRPKKFIFLWKYNKMLVTERILRYKNSWMMKHPCIMYM